jgi:hypothetical protein
MLRLGHQSKVLLAVICVVVVAMRLTGAHLHLCFDGSEPPAAVHFDHDAGLHHLDDEHEAMHTDAHSDTDLNLIADALVKKTAGFELLDLFAVFSLLLCLLIFNKQRLIYFDSVAGAFATRDYWRPPLRGPPPFASR